MDEDETLYFGYGSNLWRAQMTQRCPGSRYIGRARLPGYCWLINERGYANIVFAPPPATPRTQGEGGPEMAGEGQPDEEEVWGLVYALTLEDEAKLDRNEGVPEAYTKEFMNAEVWFERGAESQSEEREVLVYIDRERIAEHKPKKEYIYRMNMGIRDALAVGVPEVYVRRVLRRFIPDQEMDSEVENLAKRQAERFVDENV